MKGMDGSDGNFERAFLNEQRLRLSAINNELQKSS